MTQESNQNKNQNPQQAAQTQQTSNNEPVNSFADLDPFGVDDIGAEDFDGQMLARAQANAAADAGEGGTKNDPTQQSQNSQQNPQNQQNQNSAQQNPQQQLDPHQAMLAQLQAQLLQRQQSEQNTQRITEQRADYQKQLASRFNTDDVKQAFGDDQAALISNMLANVHISATEQAIAATQQMFQRQAPQMMQQHMTQLNDARDKERQFFERYPEISAPELRESITNLGRAMQQELAQLPPEARWQKLASAAAAFHGIALGNRGNPHDGQRNGQNGNQIPQQRNALPPIGLHGGNGQQLPRQNAQNGQDVFGQIFDQVSAFQGGHGGGL